MSRLGFEPSHARKLGVFLGILLGALVWSVGGCSETRKGLGETCLKDGDCVSNICSATICIAEPPVIGDGSATDTSSTGLTDSANDSSGPDGSSDAGSEVGQGIDANSDAGDAGAEAAI